MSAHALPSYHVQGIATAVEVQHLNVVVWIRREDTDDDTQAIPVAFQRSGEHVDPIVLQNAEKLEPGDAVEVRYTQIGSGSQTINLGRSITKRGGP